MDNLTTTVSDNVTDNWYTSTRHFFNGSTTSPKPDPLIKRITKSSFDEKMRSPETLWITVLILLLSYIALLVFCLITNPRHPKKQNFVKQNNSVDLARLATSQVPRIDGANLQTFDNLDDLSNYQLISKLELSKSKNRSKSQLNPLKRLPKTQSVPYLIEKKDLSFSKKQIESMTKLTQAHMVATRSDSMLSTGTVASSSNIGSNTSIVSSNISERY